MPATATLTRTPATPLSAAEADVERLTAAINELRGKGAGFDLTLLSTLESEIEAAMKLLRQAALTAEEQKAADGAVLSPKTVEKIRRQRRLAYDLHPILMARTSEHRRLRELAYSIENRIATATSAGPFKRAQEELKSKFVYRRDDQDRPEPPQTQPMPPPIEEIAKLERRLTSTITEVEIAAAVLAEAQARWQSARATLESWEDAVSALGPAARQVLASIAQPSDADSKNNSGWGDISIGPNSVTRSAVEGKT